MVKLLEIRALLRAYYQKFQLIVDPVLKFLAAFITFRAINNMLGYETRLTGFGVVFLISLLCAFVPSAVTVFLAMAVSLIHIFAINPILSILALLIFGILYLLFLRYTPQYGFVVIAIPVLYSVHMPYLIPLLAGIFASPVTVLSSTCGVAVLYLFRIMKEQAALHSDVALQDALAVYIDAFEQIIACKQILIVSAIFAVVIITVYVIRRLKMEYASEIALLAGGVVNVFGFLICNLRFGLAEEIGGMLLGTFLSLIVAFIALMFKRVLDYTAVENVQFEDDDYYYYVKAVPKIGIVIPERTIKQITDDSPEEDAELEELLDEITGEVTFAPRKGAVNRSKNRISKLLHAHKMELHVSKEWEELMENENRTADEPARPQSQRKSPENERKGAVLIKDDAPGNEETQEEGFLGLNDLLSSQREEKESEEENSDN